MKGKHLYLVVTQDEYELPLYVSDRIKEIAKYMGRTEVSVMGSMSKYYNGKIKNCPFRKVLKEEDE